MKSPRIAWAILLLAKPISDQATAAVTTISTL